MSVSTPESGSPSWTEDDRLAALKSFHVLDTEPEAAFDEITTSAAHICNAPMALVSLVDDVIETLYRGRYDLSTRSTVTWSISLMVISTRMSAEATAASFCQAWLSRHKF